MKADFTITARLDSGDRDVRVVVHDSLAALRSASTRFDQAGRDAHADTFGICHRFESRYVAADGSETPDPLCAIVRLADGYVTPEIVSHELAHAAVWLKELDGPPADLLCDNDEWFAGLLGRLVADAFRVITDVGVWS